ncbi:hypothetical protein [Marinoscillum sp. MHG1-6]|uniref:hypothetical protein n=1 Tax=Marinoscillum sp. MHG1-6 TaxID=2959627 RepID=UPI0021578BC8|nr:hypothetical protein [Marinoscillum sp. MHG1-6]
MRHYLPIAYLTCLGFLIGCENKDLTEGEAFKPREIHEEISFHFDKVTVDGIEYLILEKDNNNPHEGFGFMAFRANKLMEKQDTVISLLKTIKEQQNEVLSAITGQSLREVRYRSDKMFERFLEEESSEFLKLEGKDLSGKSSLSEESKENSQDK